ncbi:MAG: AI-2E family transporter, partial [Chitinivibrionales bacterium]|nr:AI-2E family transporter [Chitinivibrionales bacterium]
FLPLVWLFVIPLILAATFAMLCYPVYRYLFYRLWHQRAISSFVCCLLLIVGMLLPAYALVQMAISQGAELYQAIEPTVRRLLEDGVQATWFDMLRQTEVGRWLLERVNWGAVFTNLQGAIASFGTTIINRTSAGVFGLVANLLITLFITFYFLMDGNRIAARIGSLLPIPMDYKRRIAENFLLISRATVAGTLIIGLVQGSLGALTLLIFGVDAWLFWGFVMLILSIIPLVGPPFVLIPAGIFQIAKGDVWQGLGIILASLLVVSTVDNVLRPVVVGHGARMHDLLVFIATLGGLSVFGISGFIVGPAIASFLVAVVGIYRTEFVSQLQPFEREQREG